MRDFERELWVRSVSNWLAISVSELQEQYRRPDYTELMKIVDRMDKQMPELKRALMYLKNTEVPRDL